MNRRSVALTVAAAVIVSFGVAGTAIASHGDGFDENDPWVQEGALVGTTDVLRPTDSCDESSGPTTGNGILGDVHALPDPGDTGTGDGDHWFELSMEGTVSVDAFWYDGTGGECEPLGSHLGPLLPDGDRTTMKGEIPVAATHVVINGWLGSGGYALTIPVESPADEGTCDQSPFC